MGINMSKNFSGDYCKENTIDSVFRKLSMDNKINFFICIMDDTSKGDRLKSTARFIFGQFLFKKLHKRF